MLNRVGFICLVSVLASYAYSQNSLAPGTQVPKYPGDPEHNNRISCSKEGALFYVPYQHTSPANAKPKVCNINFDRCNAESAVPNIEDAYYKEMEYLMQCRGGKPVVVCYAVTTITRECKPTMEPCDCPQREVPNNYWDLVVSQPVVYTLPGVLLKGCQENLESLRKLSQPYH